MGARGRGGPGLLTMMCNVLLGGEEHLTTSPSELLNLLRLSLWVDFSFCGPNEWLSQGLGEGKVKKSSIPVLPANGNFFFFKFVVL